MPRPQVFEDKKLTLRFSIQLDSVELANAIRIFMISEVPTIAIDEVFILENTSILYDETVAHRLGLIPIYSDTDALIPKDRWDEGESFNEPNHSVRFMLEAEVPDNSEPKTVYSGDLKPVESSPLTEIIRPVFDTIPITVLAPGQKISIECIATMSRGKEHAKWQPTAVATYKEYPRVIVNKKCTKCGKCVDACIRNVLRIDENNVVVQNEYMCALCDLCVESCSEGAITVDTYPGWYIFHIESVGQLPPKRIFIKALEELRNRFVEFRELLEKKVSEK